MQSARRTKLRHSLLGTTRGCTHTWRPIAHSMKSFKATTPHLAQRCVLFPSWVNFSTALSTPSIILQRAWHSTRRLWSSAICFWDAVASVLGTFARMRSVVVEMLLVVSKMWSTTIDKISKTHKEWAEGDVVSKYIESLDFDLEFLIFWALCCDGGCKSCYDKSVESNTCDHPNYGDENLLGIICAEITVANSR